MTTPEPSAAARERARELARRIIEYLSVVPDVVIAECCHDHAVDQVLEVLIPELSARDAECLDLMKIAGAQCKAAVATARADAVRECVEKVNYLRNQTWAEDAVATKPNYLTFVHYTDAALLIAQVLESLLNNKEKIDG